MQRWETIRSGAMMVSPAEVDQALLMHPDVEEAVTFAIPDAKFGEAVASAVVLRAGGSVEPGRLKWFAATHLAAHKVPRRILILDSIPRVERRELGRALGIESDLSARVWRIQGGVGSALFVVQPADDFRADLHRPVFGIREPDLAHLPPPHTVEHVAAECVHAMRRVQREGPYALGATDASRDVALEMARQLEQAGERVEFVALFKSDAARLPLPHDRRHSWAGRTIEVSLARV